MRTRFPLVLVMDRNGKEHPYRQVRPNVYVPDNKETWVRNIGILKCRN